MPSTGLPMFPSCQLFTAGMNFAKRRDQQVGVLIVHFPGTWLENNQLFLV